MAPPSPTSIMLVNGRYFDHLAPDPSVINLDVLEHGLDVPCLNNQTTRPITVLEHSLRVRRIARELATDWGQKRIREAEMWALLHDAQSALIPRAYCLRPAKTDEMRAIKREVDFAIWDAFGISPDNPVREIVKVADSIARYFEAMLWQPGAIDWAPGIIDDRLLRHAGPEMTVGLFIERFMPRIAPRPGECWRTEVEALLEGVAIGGRS